MTLYLPITAPQPWSGATVEQIERMKAAGAFPPPRAETRIEAHRGGNDRVRMLTGRKEHTALIYTTIPDGKERLVGMLTPEHLEEIQALWQRRGCRVAGCDSLAAETSHFCPKCRGEVGRPTA